MEAPTPSPLSEAVINENTGKHFFSFFRFVHLVLLLLGGIWGLKGILIIIRSSIVNGNALKTLILSNTI